MSTSANDAPAQELRARIREAPMDRGGIARFLDELEPANRVVAIRGLGRSDQRCLYESVEGFAEVNLLALVPAEVPGGRTVRHFGRNTLPAFTHFEKRFCRPEAQDARAPSQLVGFNFQRLAPLTGPGYFTAVASREKPEVLIDYRRVPERSPEGWPGVVSNERGIARIVYGFMIDTLRGVSEHVCIGSAAKRGKDIGSWFVLCREAGED